MSIDQVQGTGPQAARSSGSPPSQGRAGARPDLLVECAADFSAWRGGQEEGLERLVRRLSPMLWQVARASRLDADTATEVVQLTWIGLTRHGEQLREPRAVVRWLVVSCRREAVRASRRHERVVPQQPEVLDLRADPGYDPEQTALLRERDRALWQAVARLDERCRRLVRVVAFADRPDYAGLARELRMPIGSLGPTRRRCLDKVRAALPQEPADAAGRTS